MIKPEITAVGRLLTPKGDTPRVHHVIAVNPDGKVKTVIRKPL